MLHSNHEQLVAKLRLRTNVYIHGPTGSGKTQGIKEAAKACKLPFYKKLLGNQTSESSIIGYMSANGEYVKGIAYDAFVAGGILCMDEVDNGNPNTTLVCNGLADREFAFPCGMREAHKDFVLVATANTIGTGSTLEYCGRNRLDAAMLNRFEFISWGYDESLEKLIAIHNAKVTAMEELKVELTPEGEKQTSLMVADIIRIRKALGEMSINHIISPRNTIQAVKAMVIGRPKLEIIKSILFKGMETDTIKRVFERSTAIKEKEIGKDGRGNGDSLQEQMLIEEYKKLLELAGNKIDFSALMATQALDKAKKNVNKDNKINHIPDDPNYGYAPNPKYKDPFSKY